MGIIIPCFRMERSHVFRNYKRQITTNCSCFIGFMLMVWTNQILSIQMHLHDQNPWYQQLSLRDCSGWGVASVATNASLQILFKCPTPAIVFGNATKPSRLAHFWEGAQSHAPATRNELWTSKRGPYVVCFVHFDFEMCFAPHWRAAFRHRNFQKCSEADAFCTFWLRNVLRATTACTFWTSQLPKVVRPWCVLYILTWKCASRHNGVHFFISHLARWLRTRRFSEPTFRPSGATHKSLEKHNVSRLSYLSICIFFLLTLSLLWSSLFYSSLLSDPFHLCFSSVHIVEVWLLDFLRIF